MAALANGSFVVTWVDTDAQEVRGQILNSDGSLRGGAFTINSNPVGEQMSPNVTALSDGRFVVVWTDQSDPKYDNNNTDSGMAGWYADVFGQVFNADGTKSGGPFQINDGVPPTHAGHQPGITALADGGFAVTWRDYLTPDGIDPDGGASAEIWLARHDKDGNQVLAPTLIDYSSNYSDVEPVVQELDNGNLVVVWSQGTVTNEINLLARIVDAQANAVADLGDIGAAYDGTPNVVQILPEIAKLNDGGFVVTWKIEDGSTGHHDYAVWGRVFNADGSARSDAFQTSVPNNVDVDPVVTALKDGRFMITWADFNEYGTLSTEVRSQVYDPSGTPSGGTFTVHTPDRANDRMPSLATLADGRVVVSWWHDGEPTVRAQILDPREGAVSVAGSALDDHYIGTAWNDTIGGGAGNDRLEGGAGGDFLNGGDGFDFATYEHAPAGVIANLAAWGSAGDAAGDSYTGVEGLIGTQFDDVLVGDGAANALVGGTGDDVLDGGSSADTLDGGAGSDTYYVSAGDQVIEGADGGYDVVYASESFALTNANIEMVVAVGTAAIGLTGDDAGNALRGNAGNNALSGGGGSDHLYGAAGSDWLNGGSGFDYAHYDEARYGNLTVSLLSPSRNTGVAKGDKFYSIEGLVFGAGNDTGYGNNAGNALLGGAGRDKLYGMRGSDTLAGGSGADLLDGGSGFDYARYDEASYGKLRVSLGNPSLNTGVAKGDTFVSIEGLILGSGSDQGYGNAGANILKGQDGKDRLYGLEGNDKLYGGTGNDYLVGGSGRDTFVFDTSPGWSNRDTIADFSVADDTIALDNAVFDALGRTGRLSKGAFWSGARAHDASDHVIYDARSGALYYDPDGTGAAAQVKIAQLTKGLHMTYADFQVI